MAVRPLIAARDVRQSALGREEPQYDTREQIRDQCTGIITAVYPVDHAQNPMGQLLVDVLVTHELPIFHLVPVAADYFHQETAIATAHSSDRQPYAPKPRLRLDANVRDLRPGTKVVVGFINQDLRAPMVLRTAACNRQDTMTFPTSRHAIDTWKDGKFHTIVEHSSAHSRQAEYPRAVDSYNGTLVLRDNKGNFYLATSIDQEPVFPGDNGIPKSPTPEGNVGISTRGAVQGNVGITTGAHPTTGDRSDGRIRIETIRARIGNLIAFLQSDAGRVWVSTRTSGDGRVYLEDKDRDYLSLHADGRAELHGEDRGVIDAPTVHAGHDECPHNVVMWPQLDVIMQLLCNVFDEHGHTEVQSGSDVSGPPDKNQSSIWSQRGPECRSDVLFTDKSPGATPHYEDDPDGES